MAKTLPADVGDTGSTPGLGRRPGEEDGNALSILAWEIPQTEGRDGLRSTGWPRSDMAWRRGKWWSEGR